MVTSIVRQSVIIKCKIKKSRFLGNYEFFYGAGLFFKLSGTSVPDHKEPEQLRETIALAAESFEPKNEEEGYLVKSLLEMSPDPERDAEMEEVFLMGLSEERPWQL